MGLILLFGSPPAPPAPPVELAADSFTVEVEFTSGVWTEVEVATLEIKRGKNHELSRSERGWATLLIRNPDRTYDPDNAASPHAGDILPMKRIRIRSTWDSVTYDNFHGFIRGWPQSWEMGLFQQVLLRADDAFAVLALAKVAGTMYTLQLYTDTVDDAVSGAQAAHYYLDEAPGATAAVDRLVGFNLTTVGTNVTFGSLLRPPTYGRPYSVEFGPNNDAGDGLSRASLPTFTSGSTNVFAWACWLRLDSLATDGYVAGYSGTTTFLWKMDSSGAAVVTYTVSGTRTSTLAGVFLADSEWHHYAIRVTIVSGVAMTVIFYRDGVSLGSNASGSSGGAPGNQTAPTNFFVGGDGGLGGSHGIDGNMSQLLIVNDNAPSGSQLEELGTPVFDRFPVGLAGLQIHSLLDGVGWPLADRDIDDGTVNMEVWLPQVGDGVLDKLLSIAEDSERGLFYAGPDGLLYFKDAATLAAFTSTASFANDGTQVPFETIETRFDDQDIWNQIEVKAGAYTAYIEDATSISLETGYGPRLLNIQTVLDSDADADALAAVLLGLYKDPHTRPVQLVLYSDHDTDVLEQIFGLGLGERVAITIWPPAGGTAIGLDAPIEGIQISASWQDTGVRAVLDLGAATTFEVAESGGFGWGDFGSGTFGG